jgi:hypothetical protein
MKSFIIKVFIIGLCYIGLKWLFNFDVISFILGFVFSCVFDLVFGQFNINAEIEIDNENDTES